MAVVVVMKAIVVVAVEGGRGLRTKIRLPTPPDPHSTPPPLFFFECGWMVKWWSGGDCGEGSAWRSG